MRSALSMMIRRFLGVLGLIPAVSDKIDQVADSAIDRLEAAIPAVKQIDEMLGQTSQRSDSTATASGNGMGQEAFNQQVLQSDLPVLVDFWAPWCGPCKAVSPVIDELAEAYAGKINVVKVNIDEDVALSDTYDVQSIPTIVFSEMVKKCRGVVESRPSCSSSATSKQPSPNQQRLRYDEYDGRACGPPVISFQCSRQFVRSG